jgi:hypothetical protein
MSGIIAAIQTGALIVGSTAAVAGSIQSFAQAGKAKKRQEKAEREAENAMKDARKRLGVNVFEQLSIQKEAYELAREAALVTGAQALQTGVEGSERGAAATAGRVAMAQAAEQARIRAAMGQELQGIQQKVVAEEGRLADIGMRIDLGVVEGAQQAARDAQEQRAAAISQGFEGITNAASMAYQAAPLYGGGGGLKNMPSDIAGEAAGLGLSQREYMKLNRQNQRALNKVGGAPQFGLGFDSSFGQSIFQNTDFSGVGGVNTMGSRIGTGGQLSPEQLEALRLRIIQDPNITGGFIQ